MAESAAGDQACWVDEWRWKNRWYEAHGFYWGNGSWNARGNPFMRDVDIARDVMAEAGIHVIASWLDDESIMQMGVGVATFGLKLAGSGGLSRLKDLLGGNVRVRDGSCMRSACAPPVNIFGWEVWFPTGSPLGQVAGLFVHELAHVIDWNAGKTFSARWGYKALTGYAAGQGQLYPVEWDRWAEGVAVWVFGNYDTTGTEFTSRYKWDQVASIDPKELTAQMNRMAELLNGRR